MDIIANRKLHDVQPQFLCRIKQVDLVVSPVIGPDVAMCPVFHLPSSQALLSEKLVRLGAPGK